MAKEEKKVEVITAVYKAYLHCPKCAVDIQRPLMGIPGVQNVDVKFENGEIIVKGINIDAKKIHARLEKWSKKKVQFVSESKSKLDEEKKIKETIKTITMKAYLHCDECEKEARRRLLNHKGVHNVKTDIKAQTITVEGAIESEKLVKFMRERVHKYVEIIPPKEKKEEKKEEKKDEKKEEKKDEKKEEKKEEKKDEKKEEKKEEKKVEKKEEKKDGKKVGEFKEIEKIEVKNKEGEVPYFIHYVYAPQLFSDENPNACSIL
ncbi:heavy metal-associated isoprenylated plant protein 4 [Primulina huaijiensis]|uniref:heavy metal-associated isoprenylated plant protein 4 n=1 Tax=Primulina huaijiensis TaxID=1492673 RepID=UPI003CC6FA1D